MTKQQQLNNKHKTQEARSSKVLCDRISTSKVLIIYTSQLVNF